MWVCKPVHTLLTFLPVVLCFDLLFGYWTILELHRKFMEVIVLFVWLFFSILAVILLILSQNSPGLFIWNRSWTVIMEKRNTSFVIVVCYFPRVSWDLISRLDHLFKILTCAAEMQLNVFPYISLSFRSYQNSKNRSV